MRSLSVRLESHKRLRAVFGGTDGRRWFGRGWRRAGVAVMILVVMFGLLTARLFVWPVQGTPVSVSAIVMLAGPGDRLPVALRLARQHQAPVLVISRGWEGYGGPCPPKVPGVKLICFEPNPGNTRGEAEFIGRLAQRDHWRSLALVTTQTQDTRARLLVERCFGGPVFVATTSLPLSDLPYEVIYQWGALFKALILYRSC